MSAIQQVKGALDRGLPTALSGTHDLHPEGGYFSASSCGMCHLRAIRDALVSAGILMDDRQEQKQKSRRVLSLGTLLHSVFDKAVDIGLWDSGGTMVRIAPIRMKMEMDGITIAGTPDGIFLHVPESPLDKPKLLIVDYKTASGYPFKKAKKEGHQEHHAAQVGTYLMLLKETPVFQYLIAEGVEVSAAIDYISKEDLDQSIHRVDVSSAISQASAWWKRLVDYLGDVLSKAILYRTANIESAREEVARIEAIGIRPNERWVCRYCPWGDPDGNCASVRCGFTGETIGG